MNRKQKIWKVCISLLAPAVISGMWGGMILLSGVDSGSQDTFEEKLQMLGCWLAGSGGYAITATVAVWPFNRWWIANTRAWIGLICAVFHQYLSMFMVMLFAETFFKHHSLAEAFSNAAMLSLWLSPLALPGSLLHLYFSRWMARRLGILPPLFESKVSD